MPKSSRSPKFPTTTISAADLARQRASTLKIQSSAAMAALRLAIEEQANAKDELAARSAAEKVARLEAAILSEQLVDVLASRRPPAEKASEAHAISVVANASKALRELVLPPPSQDAGGEGGNEVKRQLDSVLDDLEKRGVIKAPEIAVEERKADGDESGASREAGEP